MRLPWRWPRRTGSAARRVLVRKGKTEMGSKQFPPDIQVLGAAVNNIVEGFGAFGILASRILIDVGIGKADPSTGMVQLDKNAWYPGDAYLRAYARIEEELGGTVVYQAGLTIPRNAVFPPDIRDLEGALRSIDVAYHMNHGRGGKPLFDPQTGAMTEGIGHYITRRVAERHLVTECDNPYPCALDRGIVEAMAKRFEPKAVVIHDSKKPCRKKGGATCTFNVEW